MSCYIAPGVVLDLDDPEVARRRHSLFVYHYWSGGIPRILINPNLFNHFCPQVCPQTSKRWELQEQPWELPEQPWELPGLPWELPGLPWDFCFALYKRSEVVREFRICYKAFLRQLGWIGMLVSNAWQALPPALQLKGQH